MSDGQDDNDKTEDPTQKRLDEALKRGQLVFSREILHFIMLLGLAFILVWIAPYIFRTLASRFTVFIEAPDAYSIDRGSAPHLMLYVLEACAFPLLLPIGVLLVLALAGGFMQTRLNISAEPIVPKFEKISPVAGFKRLFSMRSLMEFLKGLLKMGIIGVVCYIAVRPYFGEFSNLPGREVGNSLPFLTLLINRIMTGVCSAMAFIALFDYLFQRHEFMKSMRMSRQELKEEYKQQEGDPHIKGRIKQIRMERARKRMMAAVPNADVVITNPTHFAVALSYEGGGMKAPVVVAKGQDNVALRIREVAKDNGVPIVENPPLARALHESVQLDQEIPFEHYKAVAEVISYVYKLKGKKR